MATAAGFSTAACKILRLPVAEKSTVIAVVNLIFCAHSSDSSPPAAVRLRSCDKLRRLVVIESTGQCFDRRMYALRIFDDRFFFGDSDF